MKIAVPVHDENLEVFARAGRAPWFAIFEEGVFRELRPNKHTHTHDHEGGHHHREGGHGLGHGRGRGDRRGAEHFHADEAPMDTYSPEEVELHRKDLENLSDVDILLTRAVGPNMKEALELGGIRVVKIRKKDGEEADEVVRGYLAKS